MRSSACGLQCVVVQGTAVVVSFTMTQSCCVYLFLPAPRWARWSAMLLLRGSWQMPGFLFKELWIPSTYLRGKMTLRNFCRRCTIDMMRRAGGLQGGALLLNKDALLAESTAGAEHR